MITELYYYDKFDFAINPSEYDGTNGHVIVEPWKAGLNNRRLSIEMAIAICYLTNKKLVINKNFPSFFGMPERHLIEEIFDFGDMAPYVMSFKEFCDVKNIKESYSEIKKISNCYSEKFTNFILNFTKDEVSNLNSKNIINFFEKFKGDDILFERNLFGIFYLAIHSDRMSEVKKLIAKNFRYKKELFDIAQAFIEVLGDKKYYSIHFRRKDFLKMYPQAVVSPEKMLELHGQSIPEGSKIYIATDEKIEFFEVLRNKYQVYFYNDIASQLNESYKNAWWIALIEQLICSRGIKFIGTKLSTFSSYIYRLRGYMNDIEDKNYLVINEPFNKNNQLKFKGTNFWSREYCNAWDFSH